jgi:serine protease
MSYATRRFSLVATCLVVNFLWVQPLGNPVAPDATPIAPVAVVETVQAAPPSVATTKLAQAKPSVTGPVSGLEKYSKPVPTQPQYLYKALMTPNDSFFADQWYAQKVEAPRTWDITNGNSSVVVAVIDTGYSLSHPDLSSQWATNSGEMGITASQGAAPNCTSRGLTLDKSCNNVDDDADGYKDNWRGWDFVHWDNTPQAGQSDSSASPAGHGTFVAGITAASGNNGAGVAGLAWGARLMPLQVLDDDGYGYTDDIVNAIEYAVEHGAKVINLSLGSGYNDAYMHSAVAYALANGVSVIAAAGNDPCDCIVYPANFPEVIAVGASTQQDTPASFSSYGANLDILAPGTDSICSTYWTAASPNGYACGGAGTSFAAPQVSAAAALLLSRAPGTTAANLARQLTAGATKPAGMNGSLWTNGYGHGRLSLFGALVNATFPTAFGAGGDKIEAFSLAAAKDTTSVCHSFAGTACTIRLTGPSNTVITLPAQTTNIWGDAIIYWNPVSAGLTVGSWQLESIESSSGRLTAPPMTIVVSN